MSEAEETPTTSPGRLRQLLPSSKRGRSLLISVLVIALAGTGLSTWVAETWPWPKDRFCWGAWEEDSGPKFLGDEAFGEGDDGSRTGKGTAPSREHPTGSCEVIISSDYESSYDGDAVSIDQRVSVRYGPAPKDSEERLRTLHDGFLGGDTVQLPDGLPGVVNGRGGLLVLPKTCDTSDGRPTVVTMKATGDYSSGSYKSDHSAQLGGARQAAVLLAAVAHRGMEAAGCAPDKPLKVNSPLYDLPSDRDDVYPSDDVCGIRGLHIAPEDLEDQTGSVTRDLQTCSVRDRDDIPYLQLAMIAQPRLAALYDGITGQHPLARGWRGTGTIGAEHAVVRADCAGRPTTFVMAASTNLAEFATFANASAARLGCAPIAPKGAAR